MPWGRIKVNVGCYYCDAKRQLFAVRVGGRPWDASSFSASVCAECGDRHQMKNGEFPLKEEVRDQTVG